MRHDAISTRLSPKGQAVYDELVAAHGLDALREGYSLPRFCSPADIVTQAILWGDVDAEGVLN